ncbi:hypothetical protein MRX96_008819 [Rhipicephalus microplus]
MAWRPATMGSQTVPGRLLASLLSLHRCIVVVGINLAIAKRWLFLNWVPNGRVVSSLSIRQNLPQEENMINAVSDFLNPFDKHMISLLEKYYNDLGRRPTLVVPPRPNGRPTLTASDVPAIELSGLRASCQAVYHLAPRQQNDHRTELTADRPRRKTFPKATNLMASQIVPGHEQKRPLHYFAIQFNANFFKCLEILNNWPDNFMQRVLGYKGAFYKKD